MSLPVILRPQAATDMETGHDWYENLRKGFGEEFTRAIDEMFQRIEAMPELNAVVLKDVRRGKLRRFPYVVYYRILTDKIEVIAIVHGSRNAQVWQSRV